MMRCRLRWPGLVALAVAAIPSWGRAQCELPPQVADRIGRAQIFLHDISDRRVLIGRRDIVWGDKGEPLPGLYSMRYLPGDRYPDRNRALSWFEQHHDDWIVRKCDQTSPA